MDKEFWREFRTVYWGYFRLFGIVFTILMLISLGLDVPQLAALPAAEVTRRIGAGVAILALTTALVPLIPIFVPQLWFWPWVRKWKARQHPPS